MNQPRTNEHREQLNQHPDRVTVDWTMLTMPSEEDVARIDRLVEDIIPPNEPDRVTVDWTMQTMPSEEDVARIDRLVEDIIPPNEVEQIPPNEVEQRHPA